jgi:uncharacterized protein YndB with AHSA1/START domain
VTLVESELDIAAPRERVFALLLDPARLDEWVTASRGVRDVPDELRPGSEFRQRLRLGGAAFEVVWKVVELEPPRLATWEGRGPAGSHASVRYDLAEQGGGTRFRYRNDFHLPGGRLGDLAGRIGSAPAKRAMRSSLARLERLLESEGDRSR